MEIILLLFPATGVASVSNKQHSFKLSTPLLQLAILNLILKDSSYGYKITTTLRSIYPISESSVYTALKELTEKELVTYQFEVIGERLRKYYSVTPKGKTVLTQQNPVYSNLLTGILEIITTDTTV